MTIFKEYDLVGKATKRVTLEEKKLFFTTNSLITQIRLQAIINKINQDMLELGASFLVLQCQMMRKLQEKGYLLGQGTYLLRYIQGVPEYLYFFLIHSNLYPSPTVITAKDIQSSLRNKSVQPAPIGWSH